MAQETIGGFSPYLPRGPKISQAAPAEPSAPPRTMASNGIVTQGVVHQDMEVLMGKP